MTRCGIHPKQYDGGSENGTERLIGDRISKVVAKEECIELSVNFTFDRHQSVEMELAFDSRSLDPGLAETLMVTFRGILSQLARASSTDLLCGLVWDDLSASGAEIVKTSLVREPLWCPYPSSIVE